MGVWRSPCSWKLWKLQIPALQEAGYRVVAPDLRGSGDTEPKPQEPETYAMASLVQDVVGACCQETDDLTAP